MIAKCNNSRIKMTECQREICCVGNVDEDGHPGDDITRNAKKGCGTAGQVLHEVKLTCGEAHAGGMRHYV